MKYRTIIPNWREKVERYCEGFVRVPVEFLSEEMADVAEKNDVPVNGKVIISAEFDRPWRATVIFDINFRGYYA